MPRFLSSASSFSRSRTGRGPRQSCGSSRRRRLSLSLSEGRNSEVQELEPPTTRGGSVLSAVIDARSRRAEEVEARVRRLEQTRFEARHKLRRLVDLVEESDIVGNSHVLAQAVKDDPANVQEVRRSVRKWRARHDSNV